MAAIMSQNNAEQEKTFSSIRMSQIQVTEIAPDFLPLTISQSAQKHRQQQHQLRRTNIYNSSTIVTVIVGVRPVKTFLCPVVHHLPAKVNLSKP